MWRYPTRLAQFGSPADCVGIKFVHDRGQVPLEQMGVRIEGHSRAPVTQLLLDCFQGVQPGYCMIECGCANRGIPLCFDTTSPHMLAAGTRPEVRRGGVREQVTSNVDDAKSACFGVGLLARAGGCSAADGQADAEIATCGVPQLISVIPMEEPFAAHVGGGYAYANPWDGATSRR